MPLDSFGLLCNLRFWAAGRPERLNSFFELRMRQGGQRRIGVVTTVAHQQLRDRQRGWPAPAEQTEGPTPGDAPEPAPRGALRPVASSPSPDGEEALLQDVLDIGGG